MSRQDPRSSGWGRLVHFCQREIWRIEHWSDRSARGRSYAVLRVLMLTFSGLRDNKAASRAAALSFSSLLGLGPLVAIVVLIAGFFVQPDQAANRLNSLIHELMPQLGEYDRIAAHEAAENAKTPKLETGALSTVPPPQPSEQMKQLINGFITGARKPAAGVVGAFTLVFIVLQLFNSVENAFNDIWGVRRGRSLLLRVVVYWTVLTLGAVLFFAAMTGLSAGAFFDAIAGRLPLGEELVRVLRLLLPALSLLVLVAMLTLFYRFIPNTKVWWRAAFLGAVVVAALLVLNNYLAFLYFRRVVLQATLYGSLGLIPVLLAGMYIFWLFVLVGGQLSYAVQNVRYRNSEAVWGSLAGAVREQLTLLVLLTIGRSYLAEQPPCSAAMIGSRVKVPTQILNECLNRLVQLHLIQPVSPPEGGTAAVACYQPARPLQHITLAEFRKLDAYFGDLSASPVLTHVDPLVRRYEQALEQAVGDGFFQTPLDQLLLDHPLAEKPAEIKS